MKTQALKWLGLGVVVAAGLVLVAPSAFAADGNFSATCKDGTAWSGASKRGACRGHKGVQSWNAEPAASAAPAANAEAPSHKSRREKKAEAAAAAPAAVPAAPAAPAPAPQRAAPRTASAGGAPGAPAPGGGAGKVWVNTGSGSKTYHCAGSKWYGTTKHGEYMSEAQAKAQGYHADHGKACTG